MRRVALTCAVLAALLLVAVLGIGVYGQKLTADTKNALTAETKIAQELQTLHEVAVDKGSVALADIAQQELDQLSESSKTLAKEESQTSSDSLATVLGDTADQLLDTAFSSDDASFRVFLLDAATALWTQGKKEKLVEETYPAVLTEKLEELSICTPAKNPAQAPDSLANLMNTLNKYAYVTSLLNARADVDDYGTELTKIVSKASTQASAWRTQATNALSCTYDLPARKASYSADTKNPASALTALGTQLQKDISQTLADSNITDQATLAELLYLQAETANLS